MWVFIVKGNSMSPTLRDGDILTVRSIKLNDLPIQRGDLVIVENPKSPGDNYVKRVVGLPKEQITINNGLLFINESQHEEIYLCGLPSSLGTEEKSWSLMEKEFFVMGDNRTHSTDSRELGPVPSKLLFGRVSHRYWPLNKLGRVN